MKSNLHAIPVDLMLKFEPKQAWLSHDSQIHGIDHMTRVFILQELICSQLEQQGETINRHAVRWAAATHDVGRLDDGLDPQHGQRSAQWIKENLHEHMSPEELDVASFIVHWHVPPDSEAPVMTTELKVLKDADALDRVRLGDLNTSYLRTDAALELVSLAEDLYQSYVDTKAGGAFDSVLRAASLLGLTERGAE